MTANCREGAPPWVCTFGDDGSTLYVTSDKYLVRMRLNAKGVGF